MNTPTAIMGTCPVCHHTIVLLYRDKLHKVGYCTGCGLEYGNPHNGPSHPAPRKVITDIEIQRMLNEAYGQLSEHEGRLKIATLMKCMNVVSVRMTGYGIPDIPVRKFNNWGYDIVAGYIVRKATGGK